MFSWLGGQQVSQVGQSRTQMQDCLCRIQSIYSQCKNNKWCFRAMTSTCDPWVFPLPFSVYIEVCPALSTRFTQLYWKQQMLQWVKFIWPAITKHFYFSSWGNWLQRSSVNWSSATLLSSSLDEADQQQVSVITPQVWLAPRREKVSKPGAAGKHWYHHTHTPTCKGGNEGPGVNNNIDMAGRPADCRPCNELTTMSFRHKSNKGFLHF